ncbi:hypothetical protein GNF78_13525 [Clostridium perfringens]|uniref:hypothetical protein n=1 Tax=Clostridium perfringens TaxID=1502 RepID=UPI002AC5B9F3|nr:hypothetical protein [Clostridium perfringens]MDZ5038200.1 hypothetical protein [Clostridium perfringens]
MLDKLIEEGKSFENHFTNGDWGDELLIKSSVESDYFKWMSKVGTYGDASLRGCIPDMTNDILQVVKARSRDKINYNIIIGYLESAKELGF